LNGTAGFPVVYRVGLRRSSPGRQPQPIRATTSRKPILARAQPSPFTSYHPHHIGMIS
jgi:hypothetical protein